jgi:hypothetical protein
MASRWTRITALTGVVFALLVVVAIPIGNKDRPGTDASAAAVRRYYLTHHTQVNVNAFLISLAVVFGLFFYGYLRAYFRRFPGNEWLAATFFAGAIIFGVSGVIGSGVKFTLTDNTASLTSSSLQVLNTMTNDLNWAAQSAGLAVLYLAAGFIIYRSGALPKWLAWVSWIFGILAASVFLSFIALIGTILWLLVVSILMASRNPSLDEDVESGGHRVPSSLPREI